MTATEEFMLASDAYARTKSRLASGAPFTSLDELRAARKAKGNARRDFVRAWRRWSQSL